MTATLSVIFDMRKIIIRIFLILIVRRKHDQEDENFAANTD